MSSETSEDNLFPIALLIDELRSEEPATRLASVKKLRTIALALGPKRTRTELIPFLTETVYDDDEVLWELAKQLSKFVQLIGGPEHAPCLLEPLESLAAIEETVIRDKTVDTLKTLAPSFSNADIENHFFPLIKRLANGQWFTSRTSSCSLFASVYSRCSSSIKEEIRKLYLTLCSDVTPMVRRAAASKLGEFGTTIELEHLKSEFLPILPKIATDDDQDSVRLLGIKVCVDFAGVLTQEETAAHIIPVINDASLDKSWRVRYQLAEKLIDLQTAVSTDLSVKNLVPIYVSLLNDDESEVKAAAAGKLKTFAFNLPVDSRQEIILNSLLPVVKEMVSETNLQVKTALAGIIMGLAPILGKENSIEHLLPLFLIQLKDEHPDVRLNIISNLESVNLVMGVNQLNENLVPAIMELAKDVKWRVRLAIIEYVPLLAQQLGTAGFNEQLTELCLQWLMDPIHSVRIAAVKNLAKLTEVFGEEWAKEKIYPKLMEMATSTNYLYRMICLEAMLQLCQTSKLISTTMPTIVQMATDKVPNVRFKIAQILGSLKTCIDKDLMSTSVKPTLDELSQDIDSDVKFFAKQSLDILLETPKS